MNAELLILSGAKASLIATCGLLAVHLLPQPWVTARRRIALAAVWSLLLLPWISVSMPEALPHLAQTPLPAYHPGTAMMVALMLAWGLGVLFRLCRLGAESRVLRRIASSGAPCGDGMLVVEGLCTPCMWGMIRPRILMPVTALDWSPAQWQAAVLHEQQHIRQHDGWHRIAASLVRCAFWWNPLVHALCRRLEIESELCCDEAATASSSRRAYGEMLLSLAAHSSFETVPAWAAAGSVKERIRRLVVPMSCGRWSASLRTVLVIGILTVGLVAGCCLESERKATNGDELGREAPLRLTAEAFPLH